MEYVKLTEENIDLVVCNYVEIGRASCRERV